MDREVYVCFNDYTMACNKVRYEEIIRTMQKTSKKYYFKCFQ